MEYVNDYSSRSDLINRYGNNSLLLYTLQLKFNIDDILSVASDSLTDGGDDKKCDLIYIDQDNGLAVIAQGYMKQNPQATDLAPSNKASDLNTASAWILSSNIDNIPERIKEQVTLLRTSILDGSISKLYFWYVHNLNESNNPVVSEELRTMELNANATVKINFPNNEVEVFAVEVGNETIEKWYTTSNKFIALTDKFDVETPNAGFELKNDKWKAYVTAVSSKWLQQMYSQHKDDLFSGNPRNYLGSGKKKNKINLGIKESIINEPNNFWAYNNGITALVTDYETDENTNHLISITGITVINGAQTTGAIGSLEESAKDAWVPIRFIVCRDEKIIEEIIANNNKQNEILPSDLRSNDATQNRLRDEFKAFPNYFYSGGRRGELNPYRSKEIFDPYLVAQSLLSFHGDCVTAYNSKNELWNDDKLYSSIFSEKLTASHIIFVYALLRAIDSYKLELHSKESERTEVEGKQYTFLSKRGSKMLLIYTIAKCMEGIIGKRITNSWGMGFKDTKNFESLYQLWLKVVKSILPMSVSSLENVLVEGLKSKEKAENAADTVVGMFAAIQETVRVQVADFIENIEIV